MLALLLVLTALVPLIIVLAPRQFGGQSSAGKAGGGGDPLVGNGSRRRSGRGAAALVRRSAVAVAAATALVGASIAVAGVGLATLSDAPEGSDGASASSAGQARVQAEQTGHTVSGRVSDVSDGSGSGIGDLSLELRIVGTYWGGTRSFSVVTNPDGTFMFGPVTEDFDPAFGLTLRVAPADDRYVPAIVDLVVPRAEPLHIRLGPGGTISGRVTRFLDGAPPAGASVYIDGNVSYVNVEIDDSGEFESGPLPTGTYRVSACGETCSSSSVNVSHGGEARLELVLPPPRGTYEGAFYDDEGSVHEEAIESLQQRRILEACATGRICPTEGLSRAEMAVWLGRAVSTSIRPPEITASRFADVDVDGRHAFEAPHIERFADLGITVGCGTEPLRYCPDSVVTRAEMATFLQRALSLDLPEEPAGFTDVDRGSAHARSIDALRAAGITEGCGTEPLRYCPDHTVLRGQMASFIDRSLTLLDERRDELRFQSAALIGVGARLAAMLAPGVVDLYRFEVPEGSDGLVAVETHGGIDVFARLIRVVPDALDEQIASNDDGGDGTNALIEQELAPGWYIVEVRGISSSTTGDYEISVQDEESMIQDEEVRFQSAAMIGVGARLAAMLAPGVVDLYRFEVPEGSDGLVAVETHGGIDVFARLIRVVPDALDEQIASNDDGGDGTNALIEQELAPGWYIVEVQGYSSSITGDYEISVTVE